MKAQDFKGKTVEIAGTRFHVLAAQDIAGEFSFVGYWLKDSDPAMPKIEHIMTPPEVVTPCTDDAAK